MMSGDYREQYFFNSQVFCLAPYCYIERGTAKFMNTVLHPSMYF